MHNDSRLFSSSDELIAFLFSRTRIDSCSGKFRGMLRRKVYVGIHMKVSKTKTARQARIRRGRLLPFTRKTSGSCRNGEYSGKINRSVRFLDWICQNVELTMIDTFEECVNPNVDVSKIEIFGNVSIQMWKCENVSIQMWKCLFLLAVQLSDIHFSTFGLEESHISTYGLEDSDFGRSVNISTFVHIIECVKDLSIFPHLD